MLKKCKFYIHLLMSVYFLVTGCCLAQDTCPQSRKPANFVPDDDVIIVPAVVEKNFIDEFHEKHQEEFYSAKRRLRFWLKQEQYAQDFGLEDTGIVQLPTPEEKEQFLQRNYLRFISKDVERSTNSGIQNTWEQWTADDEIDAIKTLELHEKVIVKAKKSKGKKDLKTTRTVKVGKNDFKFGFHPRPEIGMVKFTMRSSYFNARAWMGINGNQEVNVERKFTSTGSYTFVNYYVDDSRVLAAFDQRLTKHWVFRTTHQKDFDGLNLVGNPTVIEDNIFQLRFNMRF